MLFRCRKMLMLMVCFPIITIAKPSCVPLYNLNDTNLPIKEITQYINRIAFPQSNAPALLVGIVYGNESALISCGETELGKGVRPTGLTVWGVGSLSKVFTTTIMAQLLTEGKIALNDPVEKYIPSPIKVPSFHEHKVTLLDLATHTSGFLRSAVDTDEETQYQAIPTYNEGEAMHWLSSAQLMHKPGDFYLYSNFGFGLLGQSMARAMQMSYAELVENYLGRNLGMVDTTVTLTEDQKRREAKSYWTNGELIKKDWSYQFEAPSGGVYSTGNDLIKFLKYHLNIVPVDSNTAANRIGHATYIYQHQLQNPLGLGDDGMSLGWQVDFPQRGLPLMLHKNGWTGGFTSWVVVLPTEKIGVFSVSNRPYLNIDGDLKTILGMMISKRDGNRRV